MPFIGVGRAVGVIARCALWSKDDLHKAHKAGALYTLVKLTRNDTTASTEIHAEPKRIDKFLEGYVFVRWRSQPQT